MSRPLSRRYQQLDDIAVCWTTGCPWRRQGTDAETTATGHAASHPSHEVRVTSASMLILNGRDPDTPCNQAARREILADARRP
jgi:hypothetical protein